MPGLQLSLTALSMGTAQLPVIGLKPPAGVLGKDTRESMLSGVVLGTAKAVNGLIKSIRLKTGRGTKVIGTGKGISLIRKFVPEMKIIDKNITLKGIALINENAR